VPYYKFKKNDIFHNTVKAYPKYEVFIYDSKIYINNKNATAGKFATYVGHVPSGDINLNELNIDRPSTSISYPFVVKDSSLNSIGSVTANFGSNFQYGDTISGSYPVSASIVIKNRYAQGATRSNITALRTSLDSYSAISPHYAYSSNIHSGDRHPWDKSTDELSLLSIPSVFFGSSIKKGSVDLKFYVTGTLIGQLKDTNRDGELIQVGPYGNRGTGSVGGVVLYNEGFVILTGSWDLTANGHPHTEQYVAGGGTESPSWIHFGTGARDGTTTGQIPSSSFSMTFEGTNYIPTVTMLANAPAGQLNHSPNPTYALYASSSINTASSGTWSYEEPSAIPVKSTVSSSFHGHEEKFEKRTFISKIGIFDENKNLIAIAKLANPVRKRESDDLTFKLKLDI